MVNSRTKRINYKPRYTQMEAYELLPKLVRDALKEGAQQWDCGAVLRHYRKLLKSGVVNEKAELSTARMVWDWHSWEVKEGYPLRQRKVGQRWATVPQSPHNQAKATLACINKRP